MVLALIFVGWLFAAQEIYELYFGGWVPNSISELVLRAFTTPSGWKLIAVGIILVVLAILVVVGILGVTYKLISRLPRDDASGNDDGDAG